MAELSLKDKTVKGAIWSGIDNVAQYAVTFVVSIVLARLLSPEDYGLIGIVTIFVAVCGVLIAGGFSAALIRKKNVTDDDYNTVFIVNLGVSLILYAVIYLTSPLIAQFFEREELVLLTRVASLSLVIGALAIVQQARLTKRIDFKTQAKITVIASVSSGAIGIAIALLGCGVWALVAQTLSRQILSTMFLWIFNKWIPRLAFSVKSFRELFGFGWKMMASMLLDSLWKELHQVVVGKFYSPATLGQYTRAEQFSRLFSSNLTSVIQRVTFPVLAGIQDDKERMIGAYRRVIKVTMFFTAVSMFALGAVSEPLIYCLVGSKWHEASTYLPLICVSGSLYPLHAINLNMLQVQGRSDLFLVLEIIKKIIGIVPLCVGIFVGIMPMLWVSIVVSIICFFLNSHWSGLCLGYSSWMQIRDIAPSYEIALAVALSVYPIKYLPLSNWLILFMQMVAGGLVFIALNKVMRLPECLEMKEIARAHISKLLKRKLR